jgi:hypothetical protein
MYRFTLFFRLPLPINVAKTTLFGYLSVVKIHSRIGYFHFGHQQNVLQTLIDIDWCPW